ncbi:hypothetical protein IKE71_03110 [Candidatus Saccharibacteria bacterium]|nr:hypothetical protein [Candidatus Saccharibacteria bacterium]
MEEKLYFKPASYGKKAKKRPEPEKPTRLEKDKSNHRLRNLIIFALIIVIVIVIILWLLRGKTTTTGQYPANIRNESLTCKTENLGYEKVSDVSSNNKELKINMIFASGDSLSSGNLSYTLHFASYAEAHSAEAVSHAQFNIGLQELGYDAGKFNNKFSIIGSDLVITLNLSSKTALDETTRSYFLVNYKKNGELPSTLSDYKSNYESQGFSCESTLR